MKRLSLVAVGVGCLLLQGAFAQVTLPFYDGFNYAEGSPLIGSGPWTVGGTSGGGGLTNTVAAALSYPGLPGSGLGVLSTAVASGDRNVGLNFANASSGTLYASFLLDVTTAPTGNRQLAFLTSSSANSANGTVNGIFLNSSMQLGISKNSSSAPNALDTLTTLSLNTTYFVVVGYTFNGVGNEYDLWLDPTPGGSQPAADVSYTGGTDMSSLSYFFLQQRNNTSNFGAVWDFDELRIGTAWSDVTAVPEPTSLAALTGLGVLGMILKRRMRR
jgi:hypothetical protein